MAATSAKVSRSPAAHSTQSGTEVVVPNTFDEENDDDSEEVQAKPACILKKHGRGFQGHGNVVTGNKRKRVSQPEFEKYTGIPKERLKDLELSCRVSMFLNLNNSQVGHLLEDFMKDHTGSDEMRNYLSDFARRRIMSKFRALKSQTIRNLIEHVRALDNDDPEFKQSETKSAAISILVKKFNLESFTLIFNFVKNFIDLEDSDIIVHKYCKLLYVELVAYAKLYTIWEDDPERLEASEYSRKGLAHRVSICTLSSRWSKYIPKHEHLKLVQYSRRYRRYTKKRECFKSPDEDDEFYIPDDDSSAEDSEDGLGCNPVKDEDNDWDDD